MKKTTYLIAICFAIQSIAFAQYTAIPDINFEQALIDQNIDSEGTLDGQILTADAAAEVNLSVINKAISNLTGIEAFVNITALNVSYNAGISSLDLTTNTLLQSVNTEECNGINSINVSGLVAVTTLHLFGNALTALDVSTNTALQTLNVRNCNISSLDLSANNTLIVLSCRNNNMTDLDMRNGNNANITAFDSDFNNALECIFVDDANAAYLATWSKDILSTYVNNEAECNTLSVVNQDLVTFSMYPNPANINVNVFSKAQNALVEVYDITGKIVLSTRLAFGNNKINVSALQSGVYLARFSSNLQSETKKLIIN